ncbi:hypothetical protein QR680_002285 [Steinernema hermaphroditum]|uniref:Uncharacterized protein n=1 Tax=Steinernema hermaphroditum TaxID=289476 RepID=A0AA39LHY7_9BILA|nr:hypothetical protein QR680_002285 [Steinernema hermaphroditum]
MTTRLPFQGRSPSLDPRNPDHYARRWPPPRTSSRYVSMRVWPFIGQLLRDIFWVIVSGSMAAIDIRLTHTKTRSFRCIAEPWLRNVSRADGSSFTFPASLPINPLGSLRR